MKSSTQNIMQTLLKISFIISISGILFLLLISNIIKPREITTNSTLKLNEKIKIEGTIISEKSYEDFSVLTLQDDYGKIQLTCNCRNFLNKTITAEGKVSEYKNKFQINAEKIMRK